MTSPRRIGAETSKTRDLLLDCAERLMVNEGYPAVTYRALAAEAEVTAALVQYYFPTRDDIFIAAIRRGSTAEPWPPPPQHSRRHPERAPPGALALQPRRIHGRAHH